MELSNFQCVLVLEKMATHFTVITQNIVYEDKPTKHLNVN